MRSIEYTYEDSRGDEITLDIIYDKTAENEVIIKEIKQSGLDVNVNNKILAQIQNSIQRSDEENLPKQYYDEEL
jgi:hypothetical protein